MRISRGNPLQQLKYLTRNSIKAHGYATPADVSLQLNTNSMREREIIRHSMELQPPLPPPPPSPDTRYSKKALQISADNASTAPVMTTNTTTLANSDLGQTYTLSFWWNMQGIFQDTFVWYRQDDVGGTDLCIQYEPLVDGLQRITVTINGGFQYFHEGVDFTHIDNTKYLHIVVVMNVGSASRLYVNGAACISTITRGTSISPNANTLIGWSGLLPYTQGLIDDITWFEYAMTAGEVSALFNASRADGFDGYAKEKKPINVFRMGDDPRDNATKIYDAMNSDGAIYLIPPSGEMTLTLTYVDVLDSESPTAGGPK
jgi:hypothetical protein